MSSRGHNAPFFMEQLFEQNLKLLLEMNPRLKDSESSIREYCTDAAKSNPSICDVSSSTRRPLNERLALLGYTLHKITRPEVYEHYKSILQAHSGSIDSYKDLHEDIHLYRFLCEIKDLSERINIIHIDATRAITPQICCQVIALSVYNYEELLALLDYSSPVHIVFLFRSWKDFGTTFFRIDWKALVQLLESRGISYEIGACDSAEKLRSFATKKSLLLFEHTLLYSSGDPCAAELDEWSLILLDRYTSDSISYLGYVTDEYNMILNSINVLSQEKARQWRKPEKHIGGKFVVCGSGPSLDHNKDLLKELQHTHHIIAGGSNFKFLVDNDIRVDFLVLIERADEVFTVYRDYINKVGTSNTCLIMSSTCHQGLLDIFPEVAVFFRPALSPLSLFADTMDEVLLFEGPQAVNGAFAIAASFRPEQICLVGVDLGAANPDLPRSQQVLANSERQMNIPVKGNYRDLVYTEAPLLDCKKMLELAIRAYDLKVFNLSDGVLIDGAVPMVKQDYSELYCHNQSSRLDDSRELINAWLKELPKYSKGEIVPIWEGKNLRKQIYTLCSGLKSLYLGDISLVPDLLLALDQQLSLDGDMQTQVPVRIVRSFVYKSTLALVQEISLALKVSNLSAANSLNQHGRKTIAAILEQIEGEVLELCDRVDSLLASEE